MKQTARVRPADQNENSPAVGPVDEGHPVPASPSPAHALQRRLHISLTEGVPADKWPLQVRAGFIIFSAASLWALIITSARMAFN
jgi:hypothetical protein